MTKDKHLITTIISAYRCLHLLRCAVKSVLKQTYSNFQICVSGNASVGKITEFMRELGNQDLRILYYYHPQNIGVMANDEYRLARVNTPSFSIFSDGDLLISWLYKTVLNVFQKHLDAAFPHPKEKEEEKGTKIDLHSNSTSGREIA